MISTVTTMSLTVTTAENMNYSIIVIAALIIFLVLKDILCAESNRNKRIKSFLRGSNLAIVPFILVFITIVAYKIITIS